MGEPSESSKLRIGDWLVSPSLDRMERNGECVSLEPLAIALLLHLAEHSERVVSTNELIEKVWRGQIVSDGTVYQWIHRLRKALGDDSHDPRYIETIPKKGYRLVAQTRHVDSQAAEHAGGATRRWLAGAAAALVLGLAIFVYDAQRLEIEDAPPGMAQVADDPSIAVLPFETLSDGTYDARLATGIHNNLLVQLTKIDGLKVISRSSVMEYAANNVGLQAIADELGVATVLESSFQRSGKDIHVTAMLIDIASDTNIWADEFVEELSTKGLFAIQTELAIAIATALQRTLTPQDVDRLSEVPTDSLSAWEAYMLGMEYFRRADDRVYMPTAAELFEQAVTQDPDFALGWAGLSGAHTRMYWYDLDRSPERREWAIEAAERAFDLSPDLPEAHIAMSGYHHLITRDYERALAELALAERGMPGAAELYARRAFVLRRLGEWQESAANFDQALQLDPRNIDFLIQQSGVFQYSRRCDKALANLERVVEIAPGHGWGEFLYAINQSLCNGDTAPAREAAATKTDMRFRELAGWTAALHEKDFELALAYLDAWDGLDVHTFNYTYMPRASFYGVTHSFAGQRDLAARYFEEARVHLEAKLAADANDPRFYISLGEALLGLGRRDEALRLAERAMEVMPLSRDVMIGSDIQREAIVRIYAPAGDIEMVVEQADAYLSGPGRWALPGLLIDPAFDLVRDDPQFVALVEKYSQI